MLTLIRSPVSGILQAGDSLPDEVARVKACVVERPERFAWVVPTGRRKRAIVHDWLAISPSPPAPLPQGARGEEVSPGTPRAAAVLPRFFTLESFVAEALQYSPRQKRRISGPERLLRLAGAWQELTGRSAGPGVIHQFDRYIRDCQACGIMPSPTSKDAIDRLVHRYLSELNAPDGWLDRMSAVVALKEEISELESWPNRIFLQRFEAVLIDGFHRLEPVELDLIAALGKVRDVVLWLVGNPGTPAWETVEKATGYLKEKSSSTLILDRGFEDSAPATRLGLVTRFSEIGRRLFRSENSKGAPLLARRAAPPGLFKLEVDTPLEEAEETARQIKADYLDSQKTDRPLRLSDVAVIIPGPAYDPLIREVFPRAGLEFNLAGRALLVSTSRPARVLLAAIDLIQGQWRHDLLLDFLNHPLVRRRLEDAHRLNDLFEQRPRARQRMNHELWSHSWKKQLERMHHSIEGWRSGGLDLPERTALSREEYVAHKTDLAASLQRLIESIEIILKPIDVMARVMAAITGNKPLSDLIQVMKEFLDLLEVNQWLSPRISSSEKWETNAASAQPPETHSREGPVLWVEYEKDQNAYLKLLNILESLKDIPTGKLPPRAGEPGGLDSRSPDVLAALRLALDGETYQIKTEDDAGVQIFELREIRGLRFRHVYVLGLVNGQIPSLPEEGTLVRRRLSIDRLKEQLQQKETEIQFLFSQVFEAAQEKLVLSRFKLEGDRPALPSPFFTSVDDLVTLPDLPPCRLVTGMGEAARDLGRAFKKDWGVRQNRVARPESSKGVVNDTEMPFEALWGPKPTLADLWPTISQEASEQLTPMLAGLEIWHQRSRDVALDWPEMLQALFPDDHQFSPSQLETYAACPFRFFGSRVLHLEEREADPTRMHYGSLVHRVLQKFYQKMREKTGTPDDQPLPATQQSDRPRLIQLFELEKSQLDEGLLPPDMENLFVVSGGMIDLLLEILAVIEGAEIDFGVLSTEYPLEVSLGKDATGRPVLLTGKIDRVDLKRTDLQTALIIDYKTGKVPKPVTIRRKVSDGRLLQLLLYAAALQIDRPGTKVVGAAYAHLNERPKATLIRGKDALASMGEPFAGQKDPDLWNPQTALELALDLADQIRAGQFPLTRHGPDTEEVECTAYCPLRHACRHPEGYATLNRW